MPDTFGIMLGPIRPEDLPAVRGLPASVPASWGHEQGYDFVVSGSAALRLLLRARNLAPGSRVLLPAYVCNVAVDAVEQEGLQCVFADVTPRLFGEYSRATLEAQRIACVVLVHPYGILHPQTAELRQWCDELSIPLIHDAAQSYGLHENDVPVIRQDAGGLYSFGAGKAATAAGGAIAWGLAEAGLHARHGTARFDPFAANFLRERAGLASLPWYTRWDTSPDKKPSQIQVRAAHYLVQNFAAIEARRRAAWDILAGTFEELYGPLPTRASYYKFITPLTPESCNQLAAAGISFRKISLPERDGNLPGYAGLSGAIYEISTERPVAGF